LLYTMELQHILIEEIRAAQNADLQLEKIRAEVLAWKGPDFMMHEDGTLRFQNRVCVLVVEELKKKILDKGHNTPHFVHSRGNKLYKDLK